MTAEVEVVAAGELNRYADGIRDVYVRAFAAPPWNEDPAQADHYAERLARDARRPGFTAAVATADGAVTGFATAWTTPEAFKAALVVLLGPRHPGRVEAGAGAEGGDR
ncbi:hypothetical protein ACIQ1S_27720 [Streptomyces griseus]|uniref:hypothetical protein n=1 Tax=Streptomyces griseus TaxID=1911 RepID=UPI0038303723